MKHNTLKLLMALAMLLLGTQAQALLLGPEDADLWGDETSASEIVSIVEGLYGVIELYKSNVGGEEDMGYGIDEKAFASSYDTMFSNSITDPEDAVISHIDDTPSIDCPDCYLLVKDGNHSPAWYLFNIGSWDGIETIELEGFWPEDGAISHVAIFGGEHNVPEPSILALLGLGLVAMVVTRRKVK